MTGEDDIKGGIASFSIGLGNKGHSAIPIKPAPPFRVLIAGDFGLAATGVAFNITGQDAEEILEQKTPSFSVSAANMLGSHPPELEEQVSFARLKDLHPTKLLREFRFVRDLEAASGDQDQLAVHDQRYDKVGKSALDEQKSLLERLLKDDELPASAQGKRKENDASSSSKGTEGLDALLSMIRTPEEKAAPGESGSAAKTAVDAFIQKTLQETGQVSSAPVEGKKKDAPADTLQQAQARLFFESPKLSTVLLNWHGLDLLLSEVPLDLPLELYLLQLDHDLDAVDLQEVLGETGEALQAELYDIALFANEIGLGPRDTERLKVLARECAESDTVGLAALAGHFAGVPGEEVADIETPHQLLDKPGFEGFAGLRAGDAASHLALFWNDARLTAEEDGAPALFVSGAFVALSEILVQLETDVFPRLPVGMPKDYDALELVESRSMGGDVAMATRFAVGSDTAPSLALAGINVLEGVANRTSLVFRRAVTVQPGEDGRGALDQALLVSRLFSLFQEALGEAVFAGQDADEREAAVATSLEVLSRSLSDKVTFEVERMAVEDQDLIGVTAIVQGGWASGQQHSFYLPASGG
jgi:hypothetical protein